MSAITPAAPSAPFVTRLRAQTRTIDLARAGDTAITVRVEVPEVWDTVRITVSPNEPVTTIKRAALEALCSADVMAEDFVVKLRGWEVLDEATSLTDAGAINGSIFLVTHRRRRAVK